jgi:methionine synthase II (cobalamin-independent)
LANASHLHVDHVGSLLRPAELREARIRLLGEHDADHYLGPHRNAELTADEDRYIRDVVRLRDAGLSVITDGDYRPELVDGFPARLFRACHFLHR